MPALTAYITASCSAVGGVLDGGLLEGLLLRAGPLPLLGDGLVLLRLTGLFAALRAQAAAAERAAALADDRREARRTAQTRQRDSGSGGLEAAEAAEREGPVRVEGGAAGANEAERAIHCPAAPSDAPTSGKGGA